MERGKKVEKKNVKMKKTKTCSVATALADVSIARSDELRYST